jgi:hypothetical protein
MVACPRRVWFGFTRPSARNSEDDVDRIFKVLYGPGFPTARYPRYLKRKRSMMSPDRIEFTLDKNSDRCTVRAAHRAFGMHIEQLHRAIRDQVRIRCRPSQFGRFIAFRVEEGVANNCIKELDIKVMAGTPSTLDVATNPFTPSCRDES